MFTVAVPKKWESDRNRNTGLYQRDYSRDEDPTFFFKDPDPAGRKNADPDPAEKKCGSGSDLKSK